MKLECHIVRDIMGNYIEGLVSPETSADVAEHLAECENCKKDYDAMSAPVEKETFTAADYKNDNISKVSYLKKYNKARKTLIVIAAVLGAVALALASLALPAAMLACTLVATSNCEVCEDISQYEEFLGTEGKYRENYFGTNEIFPEKIPKSAEVEDFYYEYLNPWDANLLGYLVYTCDDADYAAELARLKGIDSSENWHVYGIESFPYALCAVSADEYYGVIYALCDSSANRLIYFQLQFCNYFTDIDYMRHIDPQYLPAGFDAAAGNPVRQEFDATFDPNGEPEMPDDIEIPDAPDEIK